MNNEQDEVSMREEHESACDAPEASKKRPRKKLAVLGVVAAVVVAAGVGFWVWHEQPSFCATMCHDTMGSYLETYENSDYLVARHADSDLACLDCHEPTLSQQIAELKVQLSGDYRLPLAKMETDDEFCLRDGCHTNEELTSIVVTTDKGEKVNPHVITVNASAAQMQNPHGSGGESIPCATCHTAHRPSKEIEYCYDSCHHTDSFQLCSDCHSHGLAGV